MAVYFVQAGGAGPVKIGFAKSAHARLSKMQSDNPQKLRLVALFEGGLRDEQSLHERFAKHRMQGEWFAPEVLESVDALPMARMSLARTQKERSAVKRDLGKPLTVKDVIHIAGGGSALARYFGIDHAAISRWKRIPARRLGEVARITGIPPHELRPDLAEIFSSGVAVVPVTLPHSEVTEPTPSANHASGTGAAQ